MDKYGIQINKTSRNTVLFMTNIGTTRSSVAYLIEVLVQDRPGDSTTELDEDSSPMERAHFEQRVHVADARSCRRCRTSARFHAAFLPARRHRHARGRHPLGVLPGLRRERRASTSRSTTAAWTPRSTAGRELVSTSFVIPYPPGFPILVPGPGHPQEILAFMRALDVKEIHGYRAGTRPARLHRGALEARIGSAARQHPRQEGQATPWPHANAKLKNISEIRRFFHRNEEPIYFVSATNFNLLGIDEWVQELQVHQLHRLLRRPAPERVLPARSSRTPSSSRSRTSTTTCCSTRR